MVASHVVITAPACSKALYNFIPGCGLSHEWKHQGMLLGLLWSKGFRIGCASSLRWQIAYCEVFNPYWKHLICCQTICKGKKHRLPSQAPWRLKPENSRTSTQYEKSKLNNGFTRAPSHVTLNQSKGKFTKIKAVKGSLLGKYSLTRQSQALKRK